MRKQMYFRLKNIFTNGTIDVLIIEIYLQNFPSFDMAAAVQT